MRMAVAVLGLLVSLSFRAEAAIYSSGSPRSTNNDDSCDVALLPAATLLLPYFEVDLATRTGETTLFTVVNVTGVEQIAHVTLWTDYAFPALDFNIYLTGYDVQSINLYDVFLGQVAPPDGTGTRSSPAGRLSDPNPALELDDCARLPATLPPDLVRRVQRAFTVGNVPAYGDQPACSAIGGRHTNAVGYATIDVVGSCTSLRPTDAAYYTEALRYDNVLVGDYQQVNDANNFAQGSPLVHIRAVPEDGSQVNLPRTFYSRFQPENGKGDRRQPLPSTFVARWVDGGTGEFQTDFKIWREGSTSTGAPCDKYKCNAELKVVEFVNFDEEENAVGAAPEEGPVCTPITLEFVTTATFRGEANNGELFPEHDDATAGWMYLNLAEEGEFARQAWVVSSKAAEGRYSTDENATALGNGCSPLVAQSEISGFGAPIGPAANVNP